MRNKITDIISSCGQSTVGSNDSFEVVIQARIDKVCHKGDDLFATRLEAMQRGNEISMIEPRRDEMSTD